MRSSSCFRSVASDGFVGLPSRRISEFGLLLIKRHLNIHLKTLTKLHSIEYVRCRLNSFDVLRGFPVRQGSSLFITETLHVFSREQLTLDFAGVVTFLFFFE